MPYLCKLTPSIALVKRVKAVDIIRTLIFIIGGGLKRPILSSPIQTMACVYEDDVLHTIFLRLLVE